MHEVKPSSLMRRLAGRYRPDDAGVATMLVAVLLAGGVMLGLGAIVVDVGQLHAQRQELLNGADAAALAAAKACAADSNCPSSQASLNTITQLAAADAGANSKSGKADAQILCGNVNGSSFGPCPTATGGLTHCVGTRPTNGENYVEIGVSTRMADGSTLLPPTFAGALAGGNYKGETVGACARVAWGGVQKATVFPLMISKCQWQNLTSNGTVYGPPPGPGWHPDRSLERTIVANDSTCKTKVGEDLAVLLGASWDCKKPVTTGEYVQGLPATTWNSKTYLICQGLTILDWLVDLVKTLVLFPNGQIRYLSVYDPNDTTCASDGVCTYHVVGFAAFAMTGGTIWDPIVHVLPLPIPSFKTLRICGDVPCFEGFFTKSTLPSVPGGPDFGVDAFQQIG